MRVLSLLLVSLLIPLTAGCRHTPPPDPNARPDIVKAVQAGAAKDCGCGQCAAKGCAPCKGKNCYYCVAKSLVANDCGCGDCSAKGCSCCGPGCDCCKFHLAPAQEEKPDVAK